MTLVRSHPRLLALLALAIVAGLAAVVVVGIVRAQPPIPVAPQHVAGANCTGCHTVGGPGVGVPGGTGLPVSHTGRTSDICTGCHQFAAAATPTTAATATPTTAATATPTIDMASVARGGLLYDAWWEVVGASAPTGNQALWSLQTTNTRTGADTWRCKECHGWDYKGKDGAYGSGSHKTGFPGVWDAAQSKTVAELAAILGGSTNAQHNFTGLQPADKTDLANFLKYGLVDMSKYVNYATKKPIGGNAASGKALYDGLCAACHGLDGKKLNFGTAVQPEYVDTVAKDNPQEFLHKARAGQPGSDPTMPSALVLGWTIQQQVDLLTYAQTLSPTPTPTAAPAATPTAAVLPKTGGNPTGTSDSSANGWLIVLGAIAGIGILGSAGYVVARKRIAG